ncbi:zinc finger, CCHC-type containing protein [Tanacetum coccineum]
MSIALVHGRGCVDLRFSSGKIVSLFSVLHVHNIRKNLDSSTFMSTSKLNDSIIWHARLGHVHFKTMQDMSKDWLILAFDMDTEKCKTCMLTKITKKPFQNVQRETEVLELIHSDLCDSHATPSLGNKKYFVSFIDDASRFCYVYLLHTKDEALDKFKVFKTEVELQQGSLIKRFKTDMGGEYMDTLAESRVEGCKAVVRLPDPKLKTLGERGIKCIFVGYAEHSKAFRSSINGIEDIGGSVVPKEVTEEVVVQQPEPKLRKSTRNRTSKNFRLEFQLYLIEGTRDEVLDQHSYWFNVEDDPKTFDEVLADLPPGCKLLGCKWIFKRKLKVDGTIEKFKARLVIQGFRQKTRIDYFDTYAPMARISTIRLLIALALIHNLIIHQIDVKISFLNGELDKEVYMNQPEGFIMHGNENKVYKLIKSLYGLKQTPKQWNQKFDEVVLSSGYLLNQADKCVYSKFDESGKGVLHEGHKEANIILGIKIKHESNGIEISQSRYIEKVVSQLEYSRVIGCLMYAMTYTRPDIAFAIGKLSRHTSNPVLEGYSDASWINNIEAIRLPVAGFQCGSKPIAPISIRYDSVATLAKAYSQMYNEKSRHLGVRHSMIRELVMNGAIFIEFVRSQQNLAYHLTKELARDLVLKSVERMSLKSNLVTEC